jgi:hypothetical protein
MEWLKWRWEFMRRNSEYIGDYKNVLKLREQFLKREGEEGSYFFSHEGQKEKEYCKKWDLRSSQMFDPGRQFEELFEKGALFDDREPSGFLEGFERDILNHWMIVGGLDPGAVEILRTYNFRDRRKKLTIGDREIKRNNFLICIDFKKVNSIKALKKVVSGLLDEGFKSYNRPKPKIASKSEYEFMGEPVVHLAEVADMTEETEKIKKKQAYMIDYDLILKVGDMKEREDMTNEQIAKILFPRNFDINNENAKPESKIRQISNYYKLYRELVDGDRQLSYP